MISLFGLFALAIGNFSEAYAMIPYALAGIFIVVGTLVKIQGVRSLPDNLWHFTQRNRQLVADGKIVQFHLENDLAALVPLLVLIWLASA